MQVNPVSSYERVVTCLCLLFGLLTFGSLVSSLSALMVDLRKHAEKQASGMPTPFNLATPRISKSTGRSKNIALPNRSWTV
eukprot:6079882-Amphidinium_carterae.1